MNFFQFFIKYSIHHPLSADTSFKFLAIILFDKASPSIILEPHGIFFYQILLAHTVLHCLGTGGGGGVRVLRLTNS